MRTMYGTIGGYAVCIRETLLVLLPCGESHDELADMCKTVQLWISQLRHMLDLEIFECLMMMMMIFFYFVDS